MYAPGPVFTDLAVAVADGAGRDQRNRGADRRKELFGPVASMPTTWGDLDRIAQAHLPTVHTARAKARANTWVAGAGPDLGQELCLNCDVTIAHIEKQALNRPGNARSGFTRCCVSSGRPEIAGGEALAGLLRPGNTGSNTASDHMQVLNLALAGLPEYARPRPGGPAGPRLLARSASAGAMHEFANACHERGVGFSFGFPVDARVEAVVNVIPEACWHPAIDTDTGQDTTCARARGWPRPPE